MLGASDTQPAVDRLTTVMQAATDDDAVCLMLGFLYLSRVAARSDPNAIEGDDYLALLEWWNDISRSFDRAGNVPFGSDPVDAVFTLESSIIAEFQWNERGEKRELVTPETAAQLESRIDPMDHYIETECQGIVEPDELQLTPIDQILDF